MKRTKNCQWCGAEFPRWMGVICKRDEERTKDQELFALLDEDRHGIASLHEDYESAVAILKDDAANGLYIQILRKVTGQAGARRELNDVRSPFDQMWDKREAALDRAEFEQTTL